MKAITTLSSLLLIGTTVGILVKRWLSANNLQQDKDYHLYL